MEKSKGSFGTISKIGIRNNSFQNIFDLLKFYFISFLRRNLSNINEHVDSYQKLKVSFIPTKLFFIFM